MLYPAQLYKEELKRRMISCWYEPKYQWYFANDRNKFEIPDDAYWRRDFVHLNSDGEVDGYFSYNYEDGNKSLRNFGLIGFNKNNTPFLMDVLSNIKTMFEQGAQRMEFFAFADNPAVKLYDRFIKKFGGRRIGVLHRTAYFNGKYHDTVIYEVLKEDVMKGNKSYERKQHYNYGTSC